MYATPQTLEEMRKDPVAFVKLLRDYADEVDRNQALQTQVAVQNQQILEMQPKASYYDIVLQCKNAIPITQIAKDYGWTANKMNTLLHDLGIQFHIRKTWVLYDKYAQQGYTVSKTHWFPDKYGRPQSNVVTQWTQKGRLFIYDLLKSNGYLPLCEMD
jgi:phage antirepressor YoqD-like protein